MRVLILLAVLLPACLALPTDKADQRIVGGFTATRGQFPHQVSMRKYGQHFCGGSIINAETILTAAHCVYQENGQGMTVVAGSNSLASGGVSAPVHQIFYHSEYNPQSLLNDVAILKLGAALPIGGDIQAIRLREQNARAGEVLTLSGWGLTSYPGSTPTNLQFLQMRSVDLNFCAQQLAGTGTIGTGHVCTYSPAGQGGCKGDSGGPLIDANGYQIGVVSWGIPCATGRPDVFTSVPFYKQWIYDYSK